MEMTGNQLIPVPPETAWQALNDIGVLKECIPGCEELIKISDTQFELVMRANIGPVSAKFKGNMPLNDIDPPRGYTMLFEGSGGVAGHAKGHASVALAPEGDDTRLSYTAKAMIGGKLAQLGARLIDGVARKLAGDCFTAFNAHVAGGAAKSAAKADA